MMSDFDEVPPPHGDAGFTPSTEGVNIHIHSTPKGFTPLTIPTLPTPKGAPVGSDGEGTDFSDVVWEELEQVDVLFTLAGGKDVPSYLTGELFTQE